MIHISFNPVLYVLLMYLLLAGPTTYFCLQFISWFVVLHRAVLEEGQSASGGEREICDELIAAHRMVSPPVLLTHGCLMFPISALLVLLVIGWYVGKVTDSFAPGQ